MALKSVTVTYIDEIYAHRLAWDLYGALERGRDRRAHNLLQRIMGKGIGQAADFYLDPWSTPDGLHKLRCEIEKAQGPAPTAD